MNYKDLNNSNVSQGLAVNAQGKLVEPVLGLEVNGVAEASLPIAFAEELLEEWEDEDFSLLS